MRIGKDKGVLDYDTVIEIYFWVQMLHQKAAIHLIVNYRYIQYWDLSAYVYCI